MQIEFKMFPGYSKRMIVAIERYMNNKPNNALAKNFSDPYEAFYFYINEMSLQDVRGLKKDSFTLMRKR